MKRNSMRPLAVLLMIALLCSGCADTGASGPAATPSGLLPADQAEADRLLDAQLGELAPRLSVREYARCRSVMELLYPLRRDRLADGIFEQSQEEERLAAQLNHLYERYTGKYLADGDTSNWGYSYPVERGLEEYSIGPGATLDAAPALTLPGKAPTDDSGYRALWDQMRAMLPEGAFDDFDRFVLFTDGPDETLAYVSMNDDIGDRWLIAVDPADAEDGAWFTETVLHEYCHYLTLNDEQVTYTDSQTTDTYNEWGMVSLPDSYLNAFYQEFWADYLDDRLANMDSFYFFYRHEDDFVTSYASTDPSEDIAECFTYFILWDREPDDAVWQRKLNFFYDYPELVEFRAEVRSNLDLE